MSDLIKVFWLLLITGFFEKADTANASAIQLFARLIICGIILVLTGIVFVIAIICWLCSR